MGSADLTSRGNLGPDVVAVGDLGVSRWLTRTPSSGTVTLAKISREGPTSRVGLGEATASRCWTGSTVLECRRPSQFTGAPLFANAMDCEAAPASWPTGKLTSRSRD